MSRVPTPAEILKLGTGMVDIIVYRGSQCYAARRVAALKPQPVNKWVDAAEDILTDWASTTNPRVDPTRIRRNAAKVAAHFVVPLRDWKDGK